MSDAPERIWPDQIFAWQNYRRFWIDASSNGRSGRGQLYLRKGGLPRAQHELLHSIVRDEDCWLSPKAELALKALLAEYDALKEKGDA